jgi:hypothetical protein
MTDKHSLDEIAHLLQKYPGITSATAVRISEKNTVYVRFNCADIDSLKSIAWCGVWANVSIKLGDPDQRGFGKREDFSDLPCKISIRDEQDEIPTQSQQFGVWLSYELERRGLISTVECDRLHSGWNTKLAARHSH